MEAAGLPPDVFLAGLFAGAFSTAFLGDALFFACFNGATELGLFPFYAAGFAPVFCRVIKLDDWQHGSVCFGSSL